MFTWYDAAFEFGIDNSDKVTSIEFGKGKQNTQTMIEKWNAEAYGVQNDSIHYEDIWGVIQRKVYEKKEKTLENVKWFVPSKQEWAAFAASLGTSLTTSNYSTAYGLNYIYWSSSLNDSGNAWGLSLRGGDVTYNLNIYFDDPLGWLCYVRLAATF